MGRVVLLALLLVLVALGGWWLLRSQPQALPRAMQSGPGQRASPARSQAQTREPSPPRTAKLEGSVRSEAGASIEGARVCAFQASGVAAEDEHEPRCTIADRDGAFAIDRLGAGRYDVEASADSFQPGAAAGGAVALAAGEARAGVEITLVGDAVAVRGVVRDAAGGVIVDAFVTGVRSARYGDSARTVARAGDDGGFVLWLAPGEAIIAATADGYAPAQVAAIAPSDGVDLVLTPGSTIAGRVVSAGDGAPVADAWVLADGDRQAGVDVSATARTDADGRFRITRLVPGRYLVSAQARGGHGQAAAAVLLGLGEVREALEITVHPARIVRGRVVIGGRDETCPYAQVQLIDDARGRDLEARADGEGAVEFAAVLPGEYQVEVTCEGYAGGEEARLTVGDVDPPTQQWSVLVGAALEGEVVAADDAAVAGAHVRVAAREGAGRAPVAARADEDGRFVVRGLAEGTYLVEAAAVGHGAADKAVVALEDGATERVRLVLSQGGGLRGRVVEPDRAPVARVAVEALGAGPSAVTRTDDEGRFTISGLAPGSVRVVALDAAGRPLRAPGKSDDDPAGAVVEITAGREATVEVVVARRDGSISGQVIDEDGGPIADAFVAAQRASSSAGATASSLRRGLVYGWTELPVLSDSDGSFTLTGLEPGYYTVRAFRRGGGEGFVEGVETGARITVAIQTAGALAGEVTLADGAPAQDFTVVLLDRRAGRWRREAFFQTDGHWSAEGVEAGDYDVRASAAEGTARRPVALAAGQRRDDVDLTLAPRVTITGRVVSLETGDPLPGMQTSVRPVGGSLSSQAPPADPRSVSDADGRFTLDNVQSGRVYVLATALDLANARHAFGRAVVELRGDGPIDIGEIKTPGRRLAPGERAGDLGFSLVDLEPGAPPEDVHWIVAAVRDDGPAAGLDLKPGDQINAVDGYAVDGVDAYVYGTVAKVPAETAITLDLARGASVRLVARAPP
ncbi:MAG: carboxypeptidase regulatory-like domain-containing protein [Nannocystaceae bacterium]